MQQSIMLVLVAFTSAGLYWIGVKGLGLARHDIRAAVGWVCECLGLAMFFLLVNVTIGIVASSLVRVLTGGFVSLYLAADLSVLGLSLLQGLIFQSWRARLGRR